MQVLIIDPDEARAALVAEGIRADAGDGVLDIQHWPRLELGQLESFNPDVVVIACESPDRDMLEALHETGAAGARPVVMFVDRSDEDATARALDAGVAAYIVDGFSPRRMSSVLEVATRRFALMQRLRNDLDKAKADLAARKTIDRAKGLLMRSRNFSEDEAYKAMRKLAMDTGRSMGAVAADILMVSSLMNPEERS